MGEAKTEWEEQVMSRVRRAPDQVFTTVIGSNLAPTFFSSQQPRSDGPIYVNTIS
jgi:hypothetical protein